MTPRVARPAGGSGHDAVRDPQLYPRRADKRRDALPLRELHRPPRGHPAAEARAFVDLVVATGQALGVAIEALMEPRGTYGDALRELWVGRGVAVLMLSPSACTTRPRAVTRFASRRTWRTLGPR